MEQQVMGPHWAQEKFEGTNYMLWKARAETAFQDMELLEIVMGIEKAPTPADPRNLTDEEKASLGEWIKKHTKAKLFCI
jgi:hypothetical protein